MSLYIMQRKMEEKRNLSKGVGQFSTMGVRRYHYYTGQNRFNMQEKCVGPIGTVPLKPPLTTSGLISQRVHFPTQICEDGKCASYNWVKSFNPLEHSQSDYIHRVKVAASCNDKIIKDAGKGGPCKNPDNPSGGCKETVRMGSKLKSNFNLHKNVTRGAISAHEYTHVNVYKKKCLPTPACKQPFPFIINQKGCNIFFKTPQEAIEAGFLPKDWMNCKTSDAFKNYNNTDDGTEIVTEAPGELIGPVVEAP